MPFTYEDAGDIHNSTVDVLSHEQRVAAAAKALSEIGAIDPAGVRGYLFVCIKDANDDGTVECVTLNGGTQGDKAVMLEALSDTMYKQQQRRAKRSPATDVADGRKEKGAVQ